MEYTGSPGEVGIAVRRRGEGRFPYIAYLGSLYEFSGSESLFADDQPRTNFLRAVRKRIASAMNSEKEITRRMNGHAMALEIVARKRSEAIAPSYLLRQGNEMWCRYHWRK
jgi:hypothetical protein